MNFANLGTNMRNFTIINKFLGNYFRFNSKKTSFAIQLPQKTNEKKRISEIEHDPIGQAKFANSQILDKGKLDLIATSHIDRHVVEQGQQR